MEDHSDEVALFAQCKFCIILSPKLDELAAKQLATIIHDHGGDFVIHNSNETLPQIEQFTHIISPTVDFVSYQDVLDALIPVIKPQWLQGSISRGKLANPRSFNPDPKLFFSEVVVTCGDIPEGDKDAIIGAVLAWGGLPASRITTQVTHLVDLSMDSDKAKMVLSKKLAVKIILPHWFDDCLKLGKRIDERPYLLPNPEILRVGAESPIRPAENKDIVSAASPVPDHLPTPLTPSKSPHSPRKKRVLDVLKGKKVMLSRDLDIGPHLRSSIEDLIHQGGGMTTNELSDADMFICRYREGVQYRMASRMNKDVGNLSWLYHLLTFNNWTSPLHRLLHYPTSRTGIPGFNGLKISLSNYTGVARTYLENLIAATGAECTKTLRQENTHLITAHGNSEKCTAAKEWGLQVVNHLWLEESYAKWTMLPVSEPRYTHFPRRTNLGEVVGQTRLDKSVLEELFFPANEVKRDAIQGRVMQQKDQNIAAAPTTENGTMKPPKSKATTTMKQTSDDVGIKANTPQKASDARDLKTPATARFVSEGKENATPSTTSSRKSKEAAAARLHEIAPDIALYEKEKKRVGGVVYGGRKKNDEELVHASHKRKSTEAQGDSEHEDENGEAKRLKKTKLPPVTMQLMITGYKKWVGNGKKEDADKRQLRELGILLVQDAKRCTHLAAPNILRTPKFVNALAYAPIIVNTAFVDQCLAKDELLDPTKFLLRDKAAEDKFGISLEDVRLKAQKNKNRLLRGYRISCVESIRGGFDTMKSIVNANGGVCTLFRGRVTMNGSKHEESDEEEMYDHPEKDNIYLISGVSPDQVKVWPRFRQLVHEIGKTPRIVHVNWLLDIAMSQEIRWKDEYELNESMVEP